MLEFLMEIGCEEIPDRFLPLASQQLKQRIHTVLADNSLSFRNLATFSTPRRLIVCVTDLAAVQPDRHQIITGPPLAVAFDENRQPTRAAVGFARKWQVSVEALSRVETEKGSYVAYRSTIPGRPTRGILEEAIPAAVEAMDLPKGMRWESSDFLFLRPIRWILCLLDGVVVPFEIASVRSGDRTFGHRILSGNREERVRNFVEYRQRLRACHVEIDPDERRRRIEHDLHGGARGQGGSLVEDESLLESVAHLSEHPSVLCGSFDPAFLRLPREVLVTVMQEHQKYFSLHDGAGQLLPKFLAVVDSDQTHADQIRAGHERVLRARLTDAAFFWEADLKVSLEDRVGDLKEITYQEKLGTLFEKTERVIRLSEFLCETLGKAELSPLAAQAARLSKTDLTTEMVREFSNLQGVMGGLYGRIQGLETGVAEAIYDHYRPVSLEDRVPRGPLGSIVSIADKLDTLAGAFCLGMVPTGSRDPLALRRQALGVVRILLVQDLALSLDSTLRKAYEGLEQLADRSMDETSDIFRKFLQDRLRFVFREQGFRYDEINAVIQVCWDNPLECQKRLRVITRVRERADFQSLANSFKRIKNILLKAGVNPRAAFPIDPSRFIVAEEGRLHEAILTIGPEVSTALRADRHEVAVERLASLRPLVDRFFDEVLVMADNPLLRRNRLALLVALLQKFLEVADISEIVTA